MGKISKNQLNYLDYPMNFLSDWQGLAVYSTQIFEQINLIVIFFKIDMPSTNPLYQAKQRHVQPKHHIAKSY